MKEMKERKTKKSLFIRINDELPPQCESERSERKIIKLVKKNKHKYMCEFSQCVDYPQYVIFAFSGKHRDVNYYCDRHYLRQVAKAFRDGYKEVKVYEVEDDDEEWK